MSGIKVITNPKEIERMMDDTTIQEKKVELENFLKVCVNRPQLLHSICSIRVIDGHSLDSECCSPIEEKLLYKAMEQCVERILTGCKVNGKDGHFSNGGMGSRWMDLNQWARDNKLDYCRCAFYSKKFNKTWKQEKPYMIQITVEKGR